jgi:hypothetical protein
VQQALEAWEQINLYGFVLADYEGPMEQAITALKAALEQPEQTCNCRWVGDVQTQQCTLHEAHIAAIHEWAERAKAAEAKLAALEQPEQEDAGTFNDGVLEGMLRERVHWLRQQKQEPVAWMYKGIKSNGTEHGPHLVWAPAYMDAMSAAKGVVASPLYTHPPRRECLHAEVNELKRTLALQQQSYEREIQIEVEAEREAVIAQAIEQGFVSESYAEQFRAAIRARGNT